LKKAFPFILFFIGFLIQLAALFGEHAEEIPTAIKIIAPRYYVAKLGVDELLQNRILVNTNVGYSEISRFLYLAAEEWNGHPFHKPSDLAVTNVACINGFYTESTPQGDVAFGQDDIQFSIFTVTNHMTDGLGHYSQIHDFHYSLTQLRDKIAQLKEPNMLVFCFGMFFLGTLIELIALIIEYRKDAHEAGDGEPCQNEYQSAKPTNEAY
jgi:hypothetical protein